MVVFFMQFHHTLVIAALLSLLATKTENVLNEEKAERVFEEQLNNDPALGKKEEEAVVIGEEVADGERKFTN